MFINEKIASEYTTQELINFNKQLVAIIKAKREVDATLAKNKFSVGDYVYVKGNKRTEKLEGKVTKINRKNIVVQVSPWQSYNCHPTLLMPVEDQEVIDRVKFLLSGEKSNVAKSSA